MYPVSNLGRFHLRLALSDRHLCSILRRKEFLRNCGQVAHQWFELRREAIPASRALPAPFSWRRVNPRAILDPSALHGAVTPACGMRSGIGARWRWPSNLGLRLIFFTGAFGRHVLRTNCDWCTAGVLRFPMSNVSSKNRCGYCYLWWCYWVLLTYWGELSETLYTKIQVVYLGFSSRRSHMRPSPFTQIREEKACAKF